MYKLVGDVLVSIKWTKRDSPTNEQISAFAQENKLSNIVAELMLERGFSDPIQIQEFLHPDVSGLQDPFALHDMDKALETLDTVIQQEGKIAIYGDYDADGVTSASIMKLTLKKLGADPIVYIPNRFKDGYGPNLDAYKKLVEDKQIDLLITVDNGVSGKDQIKYLKDNNVKVIVTDHHDLPDELPQADAVVHPRIPGSEYPCPYLSGAGVAFKFADALLGDDALDFVDLAAIGTVADSVALLGENRVIVSEGLKRMKENGHLGILALANKCNIDLDKITEDEIAFTIAPRLNAIGRLDDATSAMELLTTSDETLANDIVDETEDINTRRQELVLEAYNDAQKQIDEQSENGVLVLTSDKWHQGILGIVASRVVEQTHKPTMVLRYDQDAELYKGSGRSPEGFNLFDALNAHNQLFAGFGGHAQACGFSIEEPQLNQLIPELQAEPAKQGFDPQSAVEEKYDLDLNISQFSFELIKEIDQLAPFGMNNPKPVIKVANVNLTNNQAVGKDKSHLKTIIADQTHQLPAIGFRLFAKEQEIQNELCNVYGQLNINEWRGKKTLQMMLSDFEPSPEAQTINKLQSIYIDYRNKKLSKPLMERFDSIVCFNQSYFEMLKRHDLNVKVIMSTDDCNGENVLIYDRPHDLKLFQQFLESNKTAHTALYLHTSVTSGYLRPDVVGMKQFLKYLYSHDNLQMSNMPTVAQYLKINKNDIDFYLNVFFELNFVKMVNGFVKRAEVSQQRELIESPTYMKRLQRNDVEKILIESNFDGLLNWISEYDCHN
ncbi:single-stranded-DNA-specific exonuclease RecJ [Companilactobacillus furfuricola]|uniref:single-stranded-DNA-specific exonuclease RecJ n=1 Tax=Companilactobacillus furfuricola TaxID=1462575 RepID=UPI001FECEA6F|nr:single-stranded-DNA-specific exonuclease RecJ [Companilactobacillus furfuricola]